MNWNPLNPQWYEDAFDNPIDFDQRRENINKIMEEGFILPDTDGSRSSLNRNEAILNNSYDEDKIIESLEDIYLNSSHKLIASNHDNINFFKWHGYIADMKPVPSTELCEFRIPYNFFIHQKKRDQFKLSQFYRRWIKIEDMMNNWDLFGWTMLVFINQKIYSEYEIYIDEQELSIRFKCLDYWKKQNYPVFIYKMETHFQNKFLISKELCENQWEWKFPISYISDSRISNFSKAMVMFNKIGDPSLRGDKYTRVEVLGDNIEFLDIEDGYIDLTKISKFNRNYILSEIQEYLWMTIVIPKFIHEYPILLPTDVIARPYIPSLKQVYVSTGYDKYPKVKTDNGEYDPHQVYIDMNDSELPHKTWVEMIRPIVLSDAFENPLLEPYDLLFEEFRTLRDVITGGMDDREVFRELCKNIDSMLGDEVTSMIESILSKMTAIFDTYNLFFEKRKIDKDYSYQSLFDYLVEIIDDVSEKKENSDYLHPKKINDKSIWDVMGEFIQTSKEMVDRFYVIEIIRGIHERNLFDDPNSLLGKTRFQRPIEENDFWIFEYDQEDVVWRPVEMKVEHHFPDLYLITTPGGKSPLHKVYKSFFFYSDTINVLEEVNDITRSSPDWNDDIEKYYYEPRGNYKDIFMEKFYWMGVRAIYKGLLVTNTRWEVIEYIIDNASYNRFHELFITNIDPYFKLGIPTYLKHDDFGFPTDYAVDKMRESITMDSIGYKKISNFEIYLNKQWKPSYFDYVIDISKGWDPGDRILRRPSGILDMRRLSPIIVAIQTEILTLTRGVLNDLIWVSDQLTIEDYNLNLDLVKELLDLVQEIYDNMDAILNMINTLDIDIYSMDDVIRIKNGLIKHGELILRLTELLKLLKYDIEENNIYWSKRALVMSSLEIANNLWEAIEKVLDNAYAFDMDNFMKSINDLHSYLIYNKENPDDESVIDHVNDFKSLWSVEVKEARNKLFVTTTILNGKYDYNKAYSTEEVGEFFDIIAKIKIDLLSFTDIIEEFWVERNDERDIILLDKINYSLGLIDSFNDNFNQYLKWRNTLLSQVDEIRKLISLFDEERMSSTEKGFRDAILTSLQDILDSVSYIAGENRKDAARKANDVLIDILYQWAEFINHEELVFITFIDIIYDPSPFLYVMDKNKDIILAIIEYLEMIHAPFVPDSKLPMYDAIFEIEDIGIYTGGFYHNTDDTIFIPKVGSYTVTGVEGDISKVNSLELLPYRKTVFRDPCIQPTPYGSISDGKGSGLFVSASLSTRTPIVDDNIVIPYVKKVAKYIVTIEASVGNPNPYNNPELISLVNQIKSDNTKWEKMVVKFSSHMSPEVIMGVNGMMGISKETVPAIEDFINIRDGINLQSFLSLFENFIRDTYTYGTTSKYLNFLYYDNELRIVFNNFITFFGTGSLWDNIDELKELLNSSVDIFKVYQNEVIPLWDDNSNDKSNEMIIQLYKSIESLTYNINRLPSRIDSINMKIGQLKESLTDFSSIQIHKDRWYRIENISPAVGGEGYEIGDIVEIISVDDVILLQVSRTDNGMVIGIQPMMEYALPYKLTGSKDVVSRTGNGTGLVVDIKTEEVLLEDSRIFEDENTYIPSTPQYSENDLIMFKFPNIYDLPIEYDLFIGGKQIKNYYIRHEEVDNPLHPDKIDTIYINANDLIALKDMSIFIPGENYLVYQIHSINITDPGAGYAVDQNIYMDNNGNLLKLTISELDGTPLKGIKTIDPFYGNTTFDKVDPQGKGLVVSMDQMNNIDDEFNVPYYDQIPPEGISKPATLSYPQEEHEFTSTRLGDDSKNENRNKKFMYPDLDSPDVGGDPDYHWYQGDRIDNSQHPMSSNNRYDGIADVVPPTHPFIPDDRRLPPGLPPKGEYQLISRLHIHNESEKIIGDSFVYKHSDLPKSLTDWPGGGVGKTIVVEQDETHNNHRMLYTIRTFVAAGFFVYHDDPEIIDTGWNSFDIDWMNIDWYPDDLNLQQLYPTTDFHNDESFRKIKEEIQDGYHQIYFDVIKNHTSYIHNLIVDDISVFNWTLKVWEDLHDTSKWKLEVVNDNDTKEYRFKLTFLGEGKYSYDMMLYLNKIPDTQLRNAALKRNAVMDITSVIVDEVNIPARNIDVNTSQSLRIRKLFPYEQKERFKIGKDSEGNPLGYEMNFKLAPYMHFKNQIHLEDVKIFNRSLGRFENILDHKLFEVRFKDDKSYQRGYETQTKIVQSLISRAGLNFNDGPVWGWNAEFQVHIFGNVTAEITSGGYITTFTPTHCPNPPRENISLTFQLYQKDSQTEIHAAIVLVEFKTEKVEMYGDGYIHNVINPMAIVPQEFKIITLYNFEGEYEYEVIMNKNPQKWRFVSSEWMSLPTFHIPGISLSQSHIYILTDKGRFPLVNPSSGLPSFLVREVEDGTDVQVMNIYRKYEVIEIHYVPYPMRSVYTLRNIPSHGFINLRGKINKPLNKKYFEFWVNGKLLDDEVTIISPTKFFMHGLRSLKNLEIIEINRDSNEFFSDEFLGLSDNLDRPMHEWDYYTYLDAVLDGEKDYTVEEQEYLLTPVWTQVATDHPSYKDYPANVDIEEDILVKVASGDELGESGLTEIPYEFLILDPPTLEGVPMVGGDTKWEHYNIHPISNDTIVEMLNKEWVEEIASDPYFFEHVVISEDEWYGIAARMYDEYGNVVTNINEAVYKIIDPNVLRINSKTRDTKIIKHTQSYDLT